MWMVLFRMRRFSRQGASVRPEVGARRKIVGFEAFSSGNRFLAFRLYVGIRTLNTYIHTLCVYYLTCGSPHYAAQRVQA